MVHGDSADAAAHDRESGQGKERCLFRGVIGDGHGQVTGGAGKISRRQFLAIQRHCDRGDDRGLLVRGALIIDVGPAGLEGQRFAVLRKLDILTGDLNIAENGFIRKLTQRIRVLQTDGVGDRGNMSLRITGDKQAFLFIRFCRGTGQQ